ncbi:hypothetical protein D0T53_02135 [Dysgonomonas sp. 216]|uniref:hypothetical protein n=1 Tax=Dysgonomonas sp. 216 TaxID=2302934 RepID=UPI0013D587CB|nr:hypothetical protein [Dysgonomonas sp. 216]NDW17714.1 hypothetical protein [Dysgonomonas sp. 216]
MNLVNRTLFITIVSISLLSCRSGETTGSKTTVDTPLETEKMTIQPIRGDQPSTGAYASGPQAIVYKTRKDYSDLVPVTMDETKNQIISYPAPSDIYYNGKLAKPIPLKKGYLLDNRGINLNTAFLSYTYEEYSKLSEAPSMEDMLSKIVDKSPLTDLIDCGKRSAYTNEINELNALIDVNFEGCARMISRSPILEMKK